MASILSTSNRRTIARLVPGAGGPSCNVCGARLLRTSAKQAAPAGTSASARNSSRRARTATTLFAAVAVGVSVTVFYISRPSWPCSFSSAKNTPLQPDRFARLPVLDVRTCTSLAKEDSDGDKQHKLLRIQLPDPPNVHSSQGEASPMLRIMSVYVKEPALQVERAYTPLHDQFLPRVSHNPSASPPATLDLLVKRYPDGELSRYIHRLVPAHPDVPADLSVVEVRGPVETWSWRGQVPDEVIMVVGGTGITPAYQLLTSALGRPIDSSISTSPAPPKPPSVSDSAPRFTLLYAAPSPSSILLLPELAALAHAHPSRLAIKLFVERGLDNVEHSMWSRMWGKSSPQALDGIPAFPGRIGTRALQQLSSPNATAQHPSRKVLLVCGPDEMVAAIAGPKLSDGRSQGPLGGILRNLGWTSEQVHKL